MKTALRSSRRSTVSQRVRRSAPLSSPQVFAYTGAAQTFTVPAGVYSLVVDAAGAAGGSAATAAGGKGGRVQATIPVTPGEVLQINVGGAGTLVPNGQSLIGGGWNGGGASYGGGGGGGGATDIRRGANALADRILVAGGGGGGGGNDTLGIGGGGGGTTALAGSNATGTTGGAPGTPTAGGAPGGGGWGGSAGALGTGGVSGADNVGRGGGGGGGGLYGGGGGATGTSGQGGAGGGGGSSYVPPEATAVVHTQAYRSSHGAVTLSWTSYEAAVANMDLGLRLKLDEASGNPIDSAGAHTAVYDYAPAVRQVPGPVIGSKGIRMAGSTHIRLANASWMEGAARRQGGVGIWYRVDAATGAIQTLFERRDVTQYVQSFILWVREDGHLQGLLYTGTSDGQTTPNTQTLDGPIKVDGEWHRAWLTWAYDGTNTTGKLYLDGAEVASGTSTGYLFTVNSYQSSMDLGQENDNGRPFTGEVADACWALSTPTAAQIAAEYDAARPNRLQAAMVALTPAALFPMTERTGATAADIVGGISLPIIGTGTYARGVRGLIPGVDAARLLGNKHFQITGPVPAALRQRSGTLVVWVRPTAMGTAAGTTIGPTLELLYNLLFKTGGPGVLQYTGGGWNAWAYEGGSPPLVDVPTMLAVIFDNDANTGSIWMHGKKVVDIVPGTAAAYATGNFTVGDDRQTDALYAYAAVYPTKLTAGQIAALAAAGGPMALNTILKNTFTGADGALASGNDEAGQPYTIGGTMSRSSNRLLIGASGTYTQTPAFLPKKWRMRFRATQYGNASAALTITFLGNAVDRFLYFYATNYGGALQIRGNVGSGDQALLSSPNFYDGAEHDFEVRVENWLVTLLMDGVVQGTPYLVPSGVRSAMGRQFIIQMNGAGGPTYDHFIVEEIA